MNQVTNKELTQRILRIFHSAIKGAQQDAYQVASNGRTRVQSITWTRLLRHIKQITLLCLPYNHPQYIITICMEGRLGEYVIAFGKTGLFSVEVPVDILEAMFRHFCPHVCQASAPYTEQKEGLPYIRRANRFTKKLYTLLKQNKKYANAKPVTIYRKKR